jgi:hypothetical protein
MGLLKSSYRMIHIDQEDFTHHLNELREHRAWEKVPVDRPYGSEDKMLIAELGKRVDEITTELDAVKQARLAAQNRELNATAPDLNPLGSNQHSEASRENKSDTRGIGVSDTAEYAIAKLRKDRPDIHARVLAGELSPNAGMVEAGFRKKRPSRKLTVFAHLKKAILKSLPALTDDEREELRRMLE